MTKYNLKPQNFRKIAADIVLACKKESKGKAKQEIITNILRKKAGFQSMQSFDNHIEKENKILPYAFIETIEDLYKELDNFSDVDFPNQSQVRYFQHLFGLGNEMTNFSCGNNGVFECFYFDIQDGKYSVYLLQNKCLKKQFSKDTTLNEDIVLKEEFFVYVDTMENEGLFNGNAFIYRDYYTSANNITNALTQAINLIKKL